MNFSASLVQRTVPLRLSTLKSSAYLFMYSESCTCLVTNALLSIRVLDCRYCGTLHKREMNIFGMEGMKLTVALSMHRPEYFTDRDPSC